MASRPDRLAALTWLVATAAAAIAWWYGSGVQPLWWLTWFAPLPVLWLAPRARAPWAALSAFLAYAIGTLNTWVYLHDTIRLPIAPIASIVVIPGVMLTLCVLLYRRLLLRGRVFAAACAPPAVWVVFEYANSLLSPHGTVFNISYTQMDALPVIQLAAVTGMWGIGFLLLLMPSALAVLSVRNAPRRDRYIVAVSAALLLAISLAYGAWRLDAPPTSTLRVGLASVETRKQPDLESIEGQQLAARYLDAVLRLADNGAQTVVLPEASFVVHDTSIPAFADLAQLRKLALTLGVAFQGKPGPERNMAIVVQPNVTTPLTYSKRHLIPGFEDNYTPGSELTMLDTPHSTGVAICKDMDFLDTGHAYAVRRARLLLVPAWDFGIDGWLHSRMAIMRGVENGFAIARTARRGRLTLSDDRGRVVAEASSEQHDAELVGDLPLRETSTLYARFGDWFAWLDLIGLSALIATAFVRRKNANNW